MRRACLRPEQPGRDRLRFLDDSFGELVGAVHAAVVHPHFPDPPADGEVGEGGGVAGSAGAALCVHPVPDGDSENPGANGDSPAVMLVGARHTTTPYSLMIMRPLRS